MLYADATCYKRNGMRIRWSLLWIVYGCIPYTGWYTLRASSSSLSVDLNLLCKHRNLKEKVQSRVCAARGAGQIQKQSYGRDDMTVKRDFRDIKHQVWSTFIGKFG